jgi:hypothetical protein
MLKRWATISVSAYFAFLSNSLLIPSGHGVKFLEFFVNHLWCDVCWLVVMIELCRYRILMKIQFEGFWPDYNAKIYRQIPQKNLGLNTITPLE